MKCMRSMKNNHIRIIATTNGILKTTSTNSMVPWKKSARNSLLPKYQRRRTSQTYCTLLRMGWRRRSWPPVGHICTNLDETFCAAVDRGLETTPVTLSTPPPLPPQSPSADKDAGERSELIEFGPDKSWLPVITSQDAAQLLGANRCNSDGAAVLLLLNGLAPIWGVIIRAANAA